MENGLLKSSAFLKPGGRMVIVTYHSLETRIVKKFLRGQIQTDNSNSGLSGPVENCFRMMTKKAIPPSEDEMKNNPRSRSSYLRVIERKQDQN